MNFTLAPDIENYRQRYKGFVAEHIIPLERDAASFDAHENIRLDLLDQLREKAKAAGLWCPQLPKAIGGLGLPVVGMAACYEEMNFSIRASSS